MKLKNNNEINEHSEKELDELRKIIVFNLYINGFSKVREIIFDKLLDGDIQSTIAMLLCLKTILDGRENGEFDIPDEEFPLDKESFSALVNTIQDEHILKIKEMYNDILKF